MCSICDKKPSILLKVTVFQTSNLAGNTIEILETGSNFFFQKDFVSCVQDEAALLHASVDLLHLHLFKYDFC